MTEQSPTATGGANDGGATPAPATEPGGPVSSAPRSAPGRAGSADGTPALPAEGDAGTDAPADAAPATVPAALPSGAAPGEDPRG